ncbi:hypothetical protein J7T55_010282 [Diaporthe amygdali]|uniref:uncharacterized protein n=1 Tax=Phomopsis amygdali TaxID=1214568 RepID=UPI0022FDE69B|nr:uncharacterized protein J7T55_010282 [Diaporthe amygdali]KAJ0107676.1 hypothetical protein J7T55_010282 [Diaporthe amygdali]
MSLVESYLDLPYEQRWDRLKPAIVKIYLEERATLAELSERMASDLGFKAEIHQYRYQFKKWGIKKRTTTVEKEAVITALGKRRRQHGVGTSNVQLEQGNWPKSVDKKQLKRHINDSIRKEKPVSLRPGIRNLPYSALVRKLGGHAHDNPSPLSGGPQTPAYLSVSSPQNQNVNGSPQEGMSPTTQLVHRKVLIDRAQLLLDGREFELMKQMSSDERRITANWLHDFWMFAFVTTKYWGKGPQEWTLPLIEAKTLAGIARDLPPDHPSGSRELDHARSPSMATAVISPPTQLCNWSIHYLERMKYEAIRSWPSDPAEHKEQDIEDESTWQEWSPNYGRDLTSTITQGLQTNEFTKCQTEDLPLAVDSIVNTLSGSTKDAKVEAIGFAIMSRNIGAFFDLLDDEDVNWEALREISPFHLAAKFLDGSKACCGMMSALVERLEDVNSIGVSYTDHSGLTVLDALFISILRSHTSVEASVLGATFATTGLFSEGSDVDICGRWDADSPCIRLLRATGEAFIPHEWKHIFCHTSSQTVCHCITSIFMRNWGPNINTASGLFQRRCQCGLELKLGPLHAFVFVAFHLANSGMPGETLFGMLACLVCLITLKADPCLSAQISIEAVLGLGETEKCQHRSFNAADLASAVPGDVVSKWTPEVQLGWEAIKELLKYRVTRARNSDVDTTNGLSVSSRTPRGVTHDYEHCIDEYDDDISEPEDDSCRHGIHESERADNTRLVECGDQRLGTIWAAIQVELLTYRRLEVGDTWLSSMFDMRNVVEGLRATDDSVLMRMVDCRGKDAFQRFSRCGLFLEARDPGCARREEACASYFANLDDWMRTNFIQARTSFWDML